METAHVHDNAAHHLFALGLMIDPLNNPFFFAVGALCVACAIRAIYLAWTLPKTVTEAEAIPLKSPAPPLSATEKGA